MNKTQVMQEMFNMAFEKGLTGLAIAESNPISTAKALDCNVDDAKTVINAVSKVLDTNRAAKNAPEWDDESWKTFAEKVRPLLKQEHETVVAKPRKTSLFGGDEEQDQQTEPEKPRDRNAQREERHPRKDGGDRNSSNGKQRGKKTSTTIEDVPRMLRNRVVMSFRRVKVDDNNKLKDEQLYGLVSMSDWNIEHAAIDCYDELGADPTLDEVDTQVLAWIKSQSLGRKSKRDIEDEGSNRGYEVTFSSAADRRTRPPIPTNREKGIIGDVDSEAIRQAVEYSGMTVAEAFEARDFMPRTRTTATTSRRDRDVEERPARKRSLFDED